MSRAMPTPAKAGAAKAGAPAAASNAAAASTAAFAAPSSASAAGSSLSEAEKKRRAEFAFISSNAEKWIWAPDPLLCFVPSKVTKENDDGSKEVELAAGALQLVKKADLGPWILRVSDLKETFADMVKMGDVNEATILHNLRSRFATDDIYTNIGTILVSINPFKWMPNVYRSELVMQYFSTQIGEETQPHIFQIAAAAYFGLRTERKDQAIIISGESGAGKTEATKQCLKFFAEAAGSTTAGMADKLLSANPILEAFGNAKTVRNNNSSRFGKWMEVHFSGRAQICGSQIINYLLEKSRVAFQANNERNYHIFYMLPLAASPAQRAKFCVTAPEDYLYTSKNGITKVEGLDDVAEFKELMHSFHLVEIPEAEYDPLLQIVAGILHLSNLAFDAVDQDRCSMNRGPKVLHSLDTAASMWGVDALRLQKSLEERIIETRSERVNSPVSAEGAVAVRNSMCKAVYGRMFDWLVQRVNEAMEGNLKSSENVIGVLDIFGFEIFEVNSFEQLCINYCNEKLQQHFNYHIFKAEEKCYKAEEIDYAEIRYVDNQDVLDLVEKKPEGLLPKLDDECKVPKGSDEGYLEKIKKNNKDNFRFKERPRIGRDSKGENEFGVNHYAGVVYYDVRGFCEKNKDELPLQVRELLQSAKLGFLADLFSEEKREAILAKRAAASEGKTGRDGPEKSKAEGPKRGGADKETQSAQFRGQLDALMKTLNTTEPHFVRCIKPNNVKKGNIFDSPVCLQQLRYAGVFEAVRVRQLGYPFRFTYDIFYKRYRFGCTGKDFRGRIGPGFPFRERCKLIVEELSTLNPEVMTPLLVRFKFGKSMLLYKADQHRTLEMIRDHERVKAAHFCQRVYRGHMSRKRTIVLRGVRNRMRDAISARKLEPVQASMAEGAKQAFRLHLMKELGRLEARLLEEKACREQLVSIYPLDPTDHFATYEGALKNARRLALEAEEAYVAAFAKFASVKDRRECKEGLAKGVAEGNKALILRSLAKAEELRKDWGEVVTAAQIEAAHAMMAVIVLEERVLDALRTSLMTGMARGEIGALDCSATDVSELEAAVKAATSGGVEIKTTYGRNLIATCVALRDLRLAQRSGAWQRIETAVAAVAKLRADEKLCEEALAEAKQAEAEVADRRIQNELNNVLASGAPKGEIGDMDPASADVTRLAAAVERTRSSADDVGGLSRAAQQLLGSAELVLRLRVALVQQPHPDWAGVRKAVAEGLVAKLSESCANEVLRAKAELDNHAIVHQLTDVLEKGAAVGVVSRLDLSTIDTVHLAERIASAEEMGPKTARARALLDLAKLVRRVREALRERRVDELPALVDQADALPQQAGFMPERTKEELQRAKHEAENIIITRALRAALVEGGATGEVGSVDRSKINVRKLEEALRLSQTVKARSPEALWLLEVAQALTEMRVSFRQSAWKELGENIASVKGLHGVRGERGSRSGHGDAEGGTSGSHFSRHSGAGGIAASVRGRGSSQDKRPLGLPARMGSTSGTPAHVGASSSGAQGKSPGGDESFFLPREVLDECIIVQDEFDNTMTVTQLTRTLSSGGPVGELGVMDCRGVEIDQLSIALKMAQRCGVKTPLAAALFYTGEVVRDLRQSLREGDWSLAESTLRHVAINNARTALALGHELPAGLSPTYLSQEPRLGRRERAASSAAEEGPGLLAADGSPFTGLGGDAQGHHQLMLPTSAMPAVELHQASRDPAALDLASHTLVMPGLAEVMRVEAEAQYKRVMDQMVHALDNGAALGKAGKLDVRSVDVSQLAAAIDASRALGSRTRQSRHLTALCRIMWQMRTAVSEGDWASVESLLVAGAQVLGQASGQSEAERAMVPAAVRAETEVYRGEAYNVRLVDTFRVALTTHQASGEIGRLSLVDVSVRALEDGIRLALQLGVHTPEAKCMMTTAVHVRAMRLALLAGQWERLGELLDYFFASEAKTKPYTRFGAGSAPMASSAGGPSVVLSDASAGGGGGGGGGSGGSGARAGQFSTVNTQDGVGVMATWPGLVEAADGFDLAVDGVASESVQEANILQLELNNRNVILELAKACGSGAAQGEVGHLDVSTIQTGALDWAVDYAQRVGCMTLESEQALLTAQVLRRVRLALSTGDWAGLEAALGGARGKLLADVGAAELQAAQDELDNRVILSELAAALGKGRVQGRVGRVATGAIDLRPLNDAVALAQRVGPKTQDAKQMLFTAKVVARLRMCLQNEDVAECGLTLEAVRGKLLASVAFPEIRHIQDEVDNWSVLSDLAQALAKGGPEGSVGRLDLSKLDVLHLEAALNRADELGVKTTEASSLYAAAAQAYKLRSALLADNWSGEDGAGVEAVLRACEGQPMSEAVGPELDLLRGELNNRRIVVSLAEALAKGCASGAVGAIDTSKVDTADLDVAIARASEDGIVRTEEAERLLNAAKVIRRLRSTLLAGNWRWVGSVLLEARQLKHIFPPVSLRELQQAQDELDNKAIVAQVGAALREGAPSGGIGHIDAESIDVSVIDEALGYARTLGVKSIEAAQAVACAKIVRALRVAVKSSDWAEAKAVLESAAGKAMPAAATEELELARLSVDNWQVVQDLSIAVATGGPVGALGDADLRAIRVQPLNAAIEQTMKTGCHTGEARRALVTALIVMRLRSALVAQDFKLMATVLEEAEGQEQQGGSDALLPQARGELAFCRATMEFRATLEALGRATESQSEPELVEALGRAQKLGMAEHPRAHVKQAVESATMSLTRIQHAKTALAVGVRNMDGRALLDALAMAASVGMRHELVDEAKRVQGRLAELEARASAALRSMDALAMSAAANECDALGLRLPVVAELRRTLALPRGEFLRRELDLVLASVASASPDALGDGGGGGGGGARGPSAIELRVVNCTVQIKDLFFADAPDSDEMIASAISGSAATAAAAAGSGGAARALAAAAQAQAPSAGGAGSPAKQQLRELMTTNPAAAAAVATLRATRNSEDNVDGAAGRVTPQTVAQQAGPAGRNPIFLFASSKASSASASAGAAATFKPAGYLHGAVAGSSSPASAVPGAAAPPSHSALRRQLSLERLPRLKPPHMFSPRHSASLSVAESGLLRWQHEPVHTSLTLLQSPEARHAAVKAFRNILAFTGDRPLSRPVALGQEVLALGAAMPELRDEILVQLCKQLTGNPSIASAERAWVLLYLCLCTFHPSEEAENAIELFLRDHGAVPCVWALHLAQYRSGPGPAGVPSLHEVALALERARAPMLPSFVLDADTAGGVAEYASTPAPGVQPQHQQQQQQQQQTPLMLRMPPQSARSPPQPPPPQQIAVEYEDHRLQEALLANLASKARSSATQQLLEAKPAAPPSLPSLPPAPDRAPAPAPALGGGGGGGGAASAYLRAQGGIMGLLTRAQAQFSAAPAAAALPPHAAASAAASYSYAAAARPPSSAAAARPLTPTKPDGASGAAKGSSIEDRLEELAKRFADE